MKQWELESNSCIRTFHGHNSYVSSLAAAANADRLISGDGSGTVLLWEIATGQQLASVQAHSDCVSCLAVTPDGSSFVSGSFDSSLKLWRFEALQQPVLQFRGHTDRVTACVVSSNGSRLYSSDENIHVWDMYTGQLLMQSDNSGVSSLALRGSLLVSGSRDRTVKMWDSESMQLLRTLSGHSDYVHCVAVSSDQSPRVLSGGGCNVVYEDYSVRVWDAASGAQLTVLQGHSDAVACIAVSSDGRFAASASDDGTICAWDMASLSLCARLEGHADPVCSVLFV